MKDYYKSSRLAVLAAIIALGIAFIIMLFLQNWSNALALFGVVGLLCIYLHDLVTAEKWYDLMNEYWDGIKRRDMIINAYQDMDRISNNCLRIAEEIQKDSKTYLDTLGEMNQLVGMFLEGCDDEAAAAMNERLTETNLVLKKIDDRWVLCLRQPFGGEPLDSFEY